MRVLSIVSEVYPLIKTGGLADVAGALPAALARQDTEMRTLVPGYNAVFAKIEKAEPVYDYPYLFGGPARILAARAQGLELFVLAAGHLFDRPGNPYTGGNGLDWPDNAQRFAALARVGADIAKGSATSFLPDVAHCHDWQAALTPAYLAYAGAQRVGTVLTIHNMAFQGQFSASLLAELGLPPHAMSIEGVEYYGGIGYLKAGLQMADRITTVSPTYAREILTPEYGMGLDGLLRKRASAVSGIVNGIDDEVWNPATDSNLAQTYSAMRLDQRDANRLALQRRLGMDMDAHAPLFGVVSRLTSQKGLDLLLGALPELLDAGGQLAVLGAGEKILEDGFAAATRIHKGRVGATFGYDEGLAHLMQAGVDFLLVPSRFEPCGLTQLCALRYGAVPVVTRVGGLADTIIDCNEAAITAGVATGVQFFPPEASELSFALKRAFAIHGEPGTLRRLRLNGMRADVSWRGPAKRYASLYRDVAARRAA